MILVFCLLAFGVTATSQNLVSNGGFEQKAYCPVTFNQSSLNILTGWKQPTSGTPDYFHECSKKAGVPKNLFGEQSAYEGGGYAGLVAFTASKPNYREYLQVKLDRPLRSGEKVCVEVELSPAEKAAFVTDGFGIALTSFQPKSTDQKTLNIRPQLQNPRLHLLDETNYWTKISEMVIAEGGEEYVTVGNFTFDRDLTILKRTAAQGADMANDWSYLYIDDIVIKTVEEREECSCVNDLIMEQIHDPPLELGEVREIDISTILFEFDQDVITDESKEQLKSVLKTMEKHGISFMEIIGHTDVIGEDGYNFELSKRRAQAVIDYMADKGIDPSRLQISWRGALEPIANNESDTG
ncbi:MAG: OmpA family protein, partial [Flavobacteriales bacterium]|nr:OmpA family protein [Flavobacteriales bacterium]